jgi:hypothetical protein
MKRTLFLATSAIAAAFTNGVPMKLINTKTGFVVIEFKQGKVEFHDRFLEAEMKETGILIPPALSHGFEGKEVVYFGDPQFEQAFVEVYYPLCIANSVYQWQNN